MKTIATLFFLLAIYYYGYSQISITSADMPTSGDTIRYSNAMLSSIANYDTTGTNFTWNFDTLIPTSQGISEYNSANSISPIYSIFFGFTAFGLKVADSVVLGTFKLEDIYEFYSSNTSTFSKSGSGLSYLNVPIPSNYTDDDDIYRFPMTFNQNYIDSFEVTTSLSMTASYTQKGTRENIVDGWGTVITPLDTFQCIRLKSIINRRDSVKITGFPGIAVNSTETVYQWLANGEKIPVLEVVERAGIPNRIRFRDTYRPQLDPVNQVGFTQSATSLNIGDTLFLEDTTQFIALSRAWTISPNTFSYVNGTDSTSRSPEVVFSQAGTYSCSLTVNTLNNSYSEQKLNLIQVNTLSNLANGNNNANLKLYPNPSENYLVFSKDYVNQPFTIHSYLGKVVRHGVLSTSKLYHNLPTGSYFLTTYSKNGYEKQHFVVK